MKHNDNVIPLRPEVQRTTARIPRPRRSDRLTPREALRAAVWTFIVGFAVMAAILQWGCRVERMVEPTFEDDAHVWDRDRIPLSVTSMDGFSVSDMNAAVNIWNRGGCKLLSYDGAGDVGDLVIRVGDDVSEDAAGGWQLRFDPVESVWYGDALVRQPFDRRVIVLTAAHELGHLMGLAHDPTQSMSIMFPLAAGRESGYVNATHKDLDALAERYCP